MASPSQHFQLLILAPSAADAESVLAIIKRAKLSVRGAFSQNPKSLIRASHSNLVLACIGETLPAHKVAAAYTEIDQRIPLLVIAPPERDAEALQLLRAGAHGLLNPGDDLALTQRVRREWKAWNLVRQAEALQTRLKRSERHLQALLQAGIDEQGDQRPEHQGLDAKAAYRIGSPEATAALQAGLMDLLSPEYRETLEPLLGNQQTLASDPASARQATPEPGDAPLPADPDPGSPPEEPLEVQPPSVTLEPPPASGADLPPLTLASSEEPLPDLAEQPQTLSGREASDEELIEQIERALANEGFKLAYQPVVSLRGDSQEKHSVLLRLLDDQRSFRAADDLLEPAARSGRLPDVDRWVIRHALIALNERRQAGHRVHFFLSLSAAVLEDPELLIWICDQLRQQSIRGNWVSFQIQEADAQALGNVAYELAAGLKQIKSSLTLSHFGLNPGSELLLQDLPVEFIKLAPALTQGLDDDGLKQGRVKHLLEMARQQGIKTIAGCIENEQTLVQVWSAGADYVQGKLLGRPTSVFELND
jgi:EAL domain-containing protein (putative c-di-GMP-specific phosphodiesterase class I)